MRQITGVSDVEKIAVGSGDTQDVRVHDGARKVVLVLSKCSFPAALTPEEARHVARCLNASANRVEATPR